MKEYHYRLDLIRFVAIVFVIFIHSSGYVEKFIYGTEQFFYGNAFRSVVQSGVPLFLMVSGALLLGRTIELTSNSLWSFYKRRTTKVVFPFLLFSFFHFYFFQDLGNNYFLFLVKGEAGVFLWFVYMISWLYLFAPFFNNIKLNKGVFILLHLLLMVNIMPKMFMSDLFRMNGYLYIYYFFMGYYIFHHRVLLQNKIIGNNRNKKIWGGYF